MLLQGGSTEIRIERREALESFSVLDGFEIVPARTEAVALSELRAMWPGASGAAALRRLLLEKLPGAPLSRFDADEILSTVARQLATGELVMLRQQRSEAVWPPDEVVPASPREVEEAQPPPPPPVEEKTWIEIELIGEDDKPISGETYRIELPDGSLVEGQLDSAGLARVDDVDPGNCKVTFPDLDQDAWQNG